MEIEQRFNRRGPELIRHAREQMRGHEAVPANALRAASKSADLVPSFAQERMWILEQLLKGRSEYNSYTVARLTGDLNVEALRAAFDTVVRRHEVLRTVFEDVDGVPLPRIQAVGEASMQVRDLRGVPWKAILDAASAFTRAPIDLAEGPVLRVGLLRHAESDWLLTVVVHHVATDGWSMRLLCEEVSAAYSGRTLPSLPIQYADFAAWQRALLTPKRLEAHLGHWRDRLDGAAATELPAPWPRPAVLSGEGRRREFVLPSRTTEALREVAVATGASMFMVLLAGFQGVLSRFSGLDDVVVGVPSAGRSEPEVERLIGFFVNTLVLRTDLSGDPTFAKLVTQVRSSVLESMAHQDAPFEALLDALQPDRDLSRNPLFQIMFAMDDDELDELELPGVAIERVRLESVRARFDLHLAMSDNGAEISGEAVYASDVLDDATVDRVIAGYVTLLEEASLAPGKPVSDLEVVSPNERRAVERWNATESLHPEWCLHELFERQVRRTPDATAVVSGNSYLTYIELDNLANRQAEELRRLGVGPDVPVGIWLERASEMVISLLAVLKAGGCYVPLDPDVPERRVRQILADADVSIVITSQGCLFVGTEVNKAPQFDSRQARYPASLDNLVSIYYTSGSTGRPKGVSSTHRGWVNRMWWMQQYVNLRPGERVLQKTVLSFDDSAVEIFWPLVVGGIVVLLPSGQHRDPRAIIEAAIEHSIAVLQFVPSVLAAFLDELTGVDVDRLQNLRHVVSSGEALHPDLVRAFFDCLGQLGCRLVNQWGATESSIDSVAHDCVPADADDQDVAIGLPMANTQVHVLDRGLRPVPIGVVGDLYIGGVGLARGYWKDPAKTAGAFVPDPFGSGSRLYRTGDIGRRRRDGQLVILGRADDQMKIRGIRIEPAEIEHALRSLSGVDEAIVIKWEPSPGDHRLAAYITAEDSDQCPDAAAIRASLLENLPAYMVPAAYTVLDEIPRTPAGKIDRRSLPEPDPATLAPDDMTRPTTPTENLVAEIWREVLGLACIGVNQDFFDLGGHSLLAAKVVSRLRRQFDADLPLSLIFDAPTIRALAVCLETTTTSIDWPTPVAGVERPPLSFAQERLRFLDALFPGRANYNVSSAIRLHGPINITALCDAIAVVTARHSVLRSRVAVDEYGDAYLAPVIDSLKPVIAEVPAGDALALCRNLAETPFALHEGPFARFHLLHLAENDWILLTVIHHIATDGWSMHLLWSELSEAYVGHALPILPFQYGDFAAWQRTCLGTNRIESHLTYWRNRLVGARPTEVPTDRPRPAMPSGLGRKLHFQVGNTTACAVRAIANEHRATLFMVLLAAFNVTLSRYAGCDDVVVGVPVAGRQVPEVEQLVGFFVNTLVIRTDISGDPTFGDVVDRVREAVLDAFGHQDVPFGRLVEIVHPGRDLSRNPLFQIMFAVNEFALDEHASLVLDLPSVTSEAFPLPEEHVKFDLDVVLVERASGLDGVAYYATDLYDEDTVGTFIDCYLRMLEMMVSQIDRPLSALDFAQKEYASRPAEYQGPSLLARIAAQPRLAPAVLTDSGTMTYGDLGAKANQIAALLRARGVKPELGVGIVMNRTADLLAAVLAVLKVGGFYVPIDPAYPADRVAYMLSDSGVACLLTDEDMAHLPRLTSEMQTGYVDHPGSTLAYCIFTSGSTGKPKPAMISRDSLTNLVHDMTRRLRIGPGDVVAATTTVSFDIAALELFAPLFAGAACLLVDSEVASDPRNLVDALRPATVVQATPTVWRLLLRAGWDGPDTRVLCGGEAMTADLGARLVEAAGEVWNVYGPTETTIWSTAGRVVLPTISIGEPVAGTSVVIIDERFHAVPDGAVGELAIGGIGVARGYLGRPDLTADRFIPNPYAVGGRLYRTGDLARRKPGGELTLLGRRDLQVKIRGHRVELGEVEAAMAEHPAIASAVAVPTRDGDDHKLVAYVIWVDGDQSAVLLEHLKSRLPAAFVPSVIVPVAEFPLTPNGKVDRRNLHLESVLVTPGCRSLPRSQLELRVLQVWERVLGLEAVGIDQDFFAIGGHSVKAFEVTEELRRELGLEVPLRALFLNPTIAQLCAALNQTPVYDNQLTVPLAVGPEGVAPLFLIHPHGGDVSCYLPVARSVCCAFPVIGIEAVGLADGEMPLEDIGTMADRYVEEIRRECPEGPYRIAGWSFGGTVAFEVAVRLEQAGQEIAFLGLIDAEALGIRPSEPSDSFGAYVRLAEIANLDPAVLADLDEEHAIDVVLRAHRSADPRLNVQLKAETLRHLVAVSAANTRAAINYRPSTTIRADIHLFIASDLHPSKRSPVVEPTEWQARTSCQVYEMPVPGNHFQLVAPPAATTLAAALIRALGAEQ